MSEGQCSGIDAIETIFILSLDAGYSRRKKSQVERVDQEK